MNLSERRFVTCDTEVMSGEAVFAGTRVLIAAVLDSLNAGIPLERVKAAYPFLTDEHLRSARVYATEHQGHCKPRRLGEQYAWPIQRSVRVIKTTPNQ